MSAWTLPPEIADSVLDGLENDPAYRQRFSKNPRLALEEKGFAPAADDAIAHDEGIWACFHCSKLPSQAEIGGLRAELRDQLSGEANFKIFNRA